jgi:quercetin dioxygenase-like cupin family protein
MVKGWFVGSFIPTVYSTEEVEVAVKKYKKGEYDVMHFHKIATEITVVVSGNIIMDGNEYKEGDIIVIEPNEQSDFKALTDAVLTVVKIPGAKNDKYNLNKND